jgi:hypothetical protein
VNAFQKALIICGSVWASSYLVSTIRWRILYPLTGLGAGAGIPAALGWAIGAAVVFGILAGVGTGAALDAARFGAWGFLLAVVSMLGSPGSVSRREFPDVFDQARAEFATSVIAGAVALVSFYIARRGFSRVAVVERAR